MKSAQQDIKTQDPFNREWFVEKFKLDTEQIESFSYGIDGSFEIKFNTGFEEEAKKLHAQLQFIKCDYFYWDFNNTVSVSPNYKERLLAKLANTTIDTPNDIDIPTVADSIMQHYFDDALSRASRYFAEPSEIKHNLRLLEDMIMTARQQATEGPSHVLSEPVLKKIIGLSDSCNKLFKEFTEIVPHVMRTVHYNEKFRDLDEYLELSAEYANSTGMSYNKDFAKVARFREEISAKYREVHDSLKEVKNWSEVYKQNPGIETGIKVFCKLIDDIKKKDPTQLDMTLEKAARLYESGHRARVIENPFNSNGHSGWDRT